LGQGRESKEGSTKDEAKKVSSNLYSASSRTPYVEVLTFVASAVEIKGEGKRIFIIEEAFAFKAIILVSIEVEILFFLKRTTTPTINLGSHFFVIPN
jgi:hypothetical protein